MSLAADFVLNQDLSRVMFYPLYMDRFDEFCLILGEGAQERQWENKEINGEEKLSWAWILLII